MPPKRIAIAKFEIAIAYIEVCMFLEAVSMLYISFSFAIIGGTSLQIANSLPLHSDLGIPVESSVRLFTADVKNYSSLTLIIRPSYP